MKKVKQKFDLTPHVVIFVEGDTDEVFFDRLLKHYSRQSVTPVNSYEIQNMKGVGRYASSKFTGKLSADIIPRNERKGRKLYGVCCSFDTDVFEDEEAPIVNWNKVRKLIARLEIEEFCTVEVKSSIEDWLLDDLEGLCSFLKLKDNSSSPRGANGYAKMSGLFKRGGKVYAKGMSVSDFIDALNIGKIRDKHRDALAGLERLLRVKLP